MRGNLEGVGAVLRDENGFIKVISIIPGSPAAKQGMLQAEDIILQVAEKGADPVDITDMRPDDAARLIRGAKGTEVFLAVKKPDGTKKVIPITRDVVQIEDTYGKGTVQTIINLNKNLRPSKAKEIGDLGVLKLTIQKFYRITGGGTQNKGVVPDIVLPSLFRHLKSGEKYLEYSLPWDQIRPAEYTPFNGRPIDLDMIRKKSLGRVKDDPGLQTIVKEVRMADERSKKTSVSLNLADMRQKRDEAREEQKKLSARFGNNQAGLYDDERMESADGKDGKNDDISNWQEGLKKDPYVGEAENIIVDMKR